MYKSNNHRPIFFFVLQCKRHSETITAACDNATKKASAPPIKEVSANTAVGTTVFPAYSNPTNNPKEVIPFDASFRRNRQKAAAENKASKD